MLSIVCESRARSKASAVVECRNASELGIALFMVQEWAQPCSSALLPGLSTSAPALKEPSPEWRPTEVRGEQATVCVSSGTFASNPPATLFCGLCLSEHMHLSPEMLTDKCACRRTQVAPYIATLEREPSTSAYLCHFQQISCPIPRCLENKRPRSCQKYLAEVSKC